MVARGWCVSGRSRPRSWTPPNTGPTLDIVASALRGEPTRKEVTLAPVSYPDEAELRIS
jgi:hypothetical protein